MLLFCDGLKPTMKSCFFSIKSVTGQADFNMYNCFPTDAAMNEAMRRSLLEM